MFKLYRWSLQKLRRGRVVRSGRGYAANGFAICSLPPRSKAKLAQLFVLIILASPGAINTKIQ
jgi:hypothetical protein